MVYLKVISPAAENNINTQFIVLDKMQPVPPKEGQSQTCLALVADETAAVHFQLWEDECEAFEAGDIVRLTNGIFSNNRNNLVLRAGKRGRIEKVGEFTMAFVETPNMSEISWVADPTHSKNLETDVYSSIMVLTFEDQNKQKMLNNLRFHDIEIICDGNNMSITIHAFGVLGGFGKSSFSDFDLVDPLIHMG